MNVERIADGFQIEVPPGVSVLVSFRASPGNPHGFGGNVLTKDDAGNHTIVVFHGNGHGGVVCHDSQPFTPRSEAT
jgi:hypothetical protein